MSDMVFGSDGFDIEIGGGAVDSPDQLHAGNRVSKEGWAHLLCEGVELQNDEKKIRRVKVDFRVKMLSDLKTNAPIEDQIDKTYNHYINLEAWDDKKAGTKKPLNDNQWKGIRAFLWAHGLLSDEDLKAAKPKINFAAMEGRQSVGKITKQDDWDGEDGKTMAGGYKVSFNSDFFPVTHEKVADVPKDRDMLALVGGAGPSGPDLSDI